MNIYFACSITGGRQDEKIYGEIVRFLQSQGHDVPSAVFALPRDVDENAMNPVEVYQRDTQWISECDVLIAEVTTPSHGVGYEIGYALHVGKPVLCLHRRSVDISKMITGNPDINLRVVDYKSWEEVEGKLQAFLET
ncbi:MAG: nucleoside 2-deoxyribosyltransferase [Anaerolineales bacterium]|nr:nucleoside 2-deoxyribosyltransferase [Chloroflexota bacterium]MBL6981901.1 nucleoside 2-deoxyribosyltransferase [Anaerolineales bacterium]